MQGDPTHPEPFSGSIERGPFYAVQIVPGSLGTFAGLRTDAKARVLDVERRPIPGLFAVGNDAASLMAGRYPAGGITLGVAMTFGFIAAHVAAGVPLSTNSRLKPWRLRTLMFYEIATLQIRLGTLPSVVAGIEATTKSADAKGTLFGCWTSEIGALNEVYLLRGFVDTAELGAERKRLRGTTNPFGCGEVIVGLTFDSYAPFPFLPPIKTGLFGSVYEIRTYRPKHGGIEPTIAAWEAAIPARVKLSPL